jgi:hypothetical protein
MDQLSAVAERLREVRAARREFLLRWAEESLTVKSSSVHQLCLTVESYNAGQEADPFHHEWRVLGRRALFDD